MITFLSYFTEKTFRYCYLHVAGVKNKKNRPLNLPFCVTSQYYIIYRLNESIFNNEKWSLYPYGKENDILIGIFRAYSS